MKFRPHSLFALLIIALLCALLISCETDIKDGEQTKEAVTTTVTTAQSPAATTQSPVTTTTNPPATTTQKSVVTTSATPVTTTQKPALTEPPFVTGDHKGYTVPDNHGVLGHGIGVVPGRVVWAWDPECFDWNGTGYWWTASNFDLDRVAKMMESSIAALADKATAKEGWDAIFRDHNSRMRALEDQGYTKGEKIAIKVNMNGTGSSGTGITTSSFTSPAVIRALLLTLVSDVGVEPTDITVFDGSRIIPGFLIEMCSEGELAGVRFEWNDAKGKNDVTMDKSVPVVWSESFAGEESYLPTCLTGATYLINLCTVKGHDLAGVTLTAKNHFGTILNSDREYPPQAANIHGFVTAHYFHWKEGWTWQQRPMNTYTILTDFLANREIGGKTVLNIGEMIATARTQGGKVDNKTKFSQYPFNGDWPCSILVSQDPVALDSVGYDFLHAEPEYATAQEYYKGQRSTAQNYIHESALAYNPPSGTYYKNGFGENVTASLGVHEHWNNVKEKKYSRNLGKDEGIELYRITFDK
jgi:uncharacterized protein (DUF362 family)